MDLIKHIFTLISLPVLRFFSNLLENYFIKKDTEEKTRKKIYLKEMENHLDDVKRSNKVRKSVDNMSDDNVYSELYSNPETRSRD